MGKATTTGVALLSLGFALTLTVNTFGEEHAKTDSTVAKVSAHAELQSCADPALKVGRAKLVERPSEEGITLVDISLEVADATLTPGKHAVHIHETGQCDPCGAAKGHFDPGPNSNTSPDGNHPFHMGDLVNIDVDEQGQGLLEVATSRITLSDGPLSLFDEDGSAFIVHVGADSYCKDGEEAGCAGGARAACGIIHRVE